MIERLKIPGECNNFIGNSGDAARNNANLFSYIKIAIVMHRSVEYPKQLVGTRRTWVAFKTNGVRDRIYRFCPEIIPEIPFERSHSTIREL